MFKKAKIISEQEFFKAHEGDLIYGKENLMVIMHATETCYGLAADIYEEDALNKLYKIKKMSAEKPVSMMVGNLDEAKKYAKFNEKAVELADKFWPGPLTLILPRSEQLPDFFNPYSDNVGIRCPDSKISQALIDFFGNPLTTTSANITGRLQVHSVFDYIKQLSEYDVPPDLIIDSGELTRNKPSTIVKIEGDECVLARRGDMALEIEKHI